MNRQITKGSVLANVLDDFKLEVERAVADELENYVNSNDENFCVEIPIKGGYFVYIEGSTSHREMHDGGCTDEYGNYEWPTYYDLDHWNIETAYVGNADNEDMINLNTRNIEIMLDDAICND